MSQKLFRYGYVVFLCFAVALSGLMFTSCNATGIGSGDLEISVFDGQERSILPGSTQRSVNAISISGTSTSGATLPTQSFRLGGKIAISGLSAGSWNITITGYNGTETILGTQLTNPAKQTVVILSGKTTAATFNLHYLKEGDGDASVDVTWPSENSSISSVTGTVKTEMDVEPTNTVASSIPTEGSMASAHLSFSDIDVGNYNFDLALTNKSGTTISLPMIDMVNIFNELTATGTIALVAADVPFVATPVISASEQPTVQQTEENHRTVSIVSPTPVATVYYYLLDENESGEFNFDSKTEYTGPFDIVVSEDATSITKYVRAIAVKDGYQDSLPASGTVTVNGAGGTDVVVTKPTLVSNVTVVRENATAENPAFAVTYSIQGNLAIDTFTWYVDGVEAVDTDEDANGNTFTYGSTLAAGQHQIMVKLGYKDGDGVAETVSGSLRLSISDTIATPVITSEAVTGGQQVAITCATKGASIYYTTDGVTSPTSASSCYSNPFVIDETSTIKAIAIMDGAGNSDVATSNVLTVDTLSEPTFIFSETDKSVSITCDGADTIYYTLDGTDPIESSAVYSETPFTIKETSTVKAIAVAVGKAKSPIAETTYTITYSVGVTGPAGGVIFYVNPSASSDGWTYLEAAPAVETGPTIWTDNVTVGDTESAIGSGEVNTCYMTAKAESGAAVVCSDKTTGGYEDWFLPSLEELRAYTDLPSGTYWSSSEASTSSAWVLVKDANGDVSDKSVLKTQEHVVFAIRSFQ